MRNQYFRTKITDLFKIKHPILCGGLMWLGNAEYAAAAVNAGGMGFLTAKTFPDPIEFKDELLKAWDLTSERDPLSNNSWPWLFFTVVSFFVLS